MQAILDTPSSFPQSRYAYSAPVRIAGIVAMIVGVMVAAAIAGAIMLVKLPFSAVAGR